MRSELNIAAKSYARVMQAQGGAARHHRKWRRLPLGSLCAGRLITVRSVRPAGNRRPAKGARRDRRRIFWRNKVEQSGTVEMAEVFGVFLLKSCKWPKIFEVLTAEKAN